MLILHLILALLDHYKIYFSFKYIVIYILKNGKMKSLAK